MTAAQAIPRAFDHVYLDFSGHFHYFWKCEQVGWADADPIPALIERAREDIERILQTVRPRKTVTLVMDGPNPLAKLMESNKRHLHNMERLAEQGKSELPIMNFSVSKTGARLREGMLGRPGRYSARG